MQILINFANKIAKFANFDNFAMRSDRGGSAAPAGRRAGRARLDTEARAPPYYSTCDEIALKNEKNIHNELHMYKTLK